LFTRNYSGKEHWQSNKNWKKSHHLL